MHWLCASLGLVNFCVYSMKSLMPKLNIKMKQNDVCIDHLEWFNSLRTRHSCLCFPLMVKQYLSIWEQNMLIYFKIRRCVHYSQANLLDWLWTLQVYSWWLSAGLVLFWPCFVSWWWVGGGDFSKVVATFSRVGGSFDLSWPPPEMSEKFHLFEFGVMCCMLSTFHVSS